MTKGMSVRKPAGLINEGNTCYVNSVLQSLANEPKMLDFLKELGQKSLYARNLRSLLQDINRGGKPFRISDRWKSEFRRNGSQQDSQEYLIFCLSKLASQKVDGFPQKSPFVGHCLSCLYCYICHSIRSSVHQFTIYSLYNANGRNKTITNCLNNSVKPEKVSVFCCNQKMSKTLSILKPVPILILHINRSNYSSKGLFKNNHNVIFERELNIYDSILTTNAYGDLDGYKQDHEQENFVEEKSFTNGTNCQNGTSNSSISNNDSVSNPIKKSKFFSNMAGIKFRGDLEILNRYNTSPTAKIAKDIYPEDCNYELTSVVVHEGGANGGHYVCFRKDSDDKWFSASDESIDIGTWNDVKNHQAYLLFYSQKTSLKSKLKNSVNLSSPGTSSGSSSLSSSISESYYPSVSNFSLSMLSKKYCSVPQYCNKIPVDHKLKFLDETNYSTSNYNRNFFVTIDQKKL